MRIRVFILICVALGWGSIYAQETPTEIPEAPTNRISTLELDQPLRSRGQLGGMTVDLLGYIYVANFADMVWRVSPEGEVRVLTDGMYGASGNTVDAQGNLFQANFMSHAIVKIDRFGEVTPYVQGGALNGPVGMAFDSTGNLMVCNCNDNRILKITPDRQIETLAQGDLFNCPNGIVMDKEGNFMVVNFGNDHIIKITPEGEASRFATIPGPEGNAHIAFLNDNFYITKIKTNRLYRLTPAGDYELFAGTGLPESIDGPADKAAFARPNGIAADPTAGVLYVNDLNGGWGTRQPTKILVRKVEPATLLAILSHKLDHESAEAALDAYHAYVKEPMHAHEDTWMTIATLSWRYLGQRKFTEAMALFTLNAEVYPDRWMSWYNLGEVHKIFGQNDKAIEAYNKAKELNPDNPNIAAKLRDLDQ